MVTRSFQFVAPASLVAGIFILANFILAIHPASVLAQVTQQVTQQGIMVQSVFGEEDQGSSLRRQVLDTFTAALNDHGIPAVGEPQRTLYFDVTTVEGTGEQGMVVLSVLESYNLPTSVVEWGAREEVFYLQFTSTAEDLSEEGREVREYMSKDWLEQFVQVHDQHMLVFDKASMKQHIDSFIAGLGGGE